MRPLDSVPAFPLTRVAGCASLGELVPLLKCPQSRNERLHPVTWRIHYVAERFVRLGSGSGSGSSSLVVKRRDATVYRGRSRSLIAIASQFTPSLLHAWRLTGSERGSYDSQAHVLVLDPGPVLVLVLSTTCLPPASTGDHRNTPAAYECLLPVFFFFFQTSVQLTNNEMIETNTA